MTTAVSLAAVIVLLYVVKTVSKPILERLGERIGKWLLPEDRPISYRSAWLLANIAQRLAPKFSPARNAAAAAMAELEEVARVGATDIRPLAMARSVVRPCLAARARVTMQSAPRAVMVTALSVTPVLNVVVWIDCWEERNSRHMDRVVLRRNLRGFHRYLAIAYYGLLPVCPFIGLALLELGLPAVGITMLVVSGPAMLLFVSVWLGLFSWG